MEFWKKPLWRVPLVSAGTGIVCSILSFLMAFVWGRIQIARGARSGHRRLPDLHRVFVGSLRNPGLRPVLAGRVALCPRPGTQADLPFRHHHGGLAGRAAGLGADQSSYGRVLHVGLLPLRYRGSFLLGLPTAVPPLRSGVLAAGRSGPVYAVSLHPAWKIQSRSLTGAAFPCFFYGRSGNFLHSLSSSSRRTRISALEKRAVTSAVSSPSMVLGR